MLSRAAPITSPSPRPSLEAGHWGLQQAVQHCCWSVFRRHCRSTLFRLGYLTLRGKNLNRQANRSNIQRQQQSLPWCIPLSSLAIGLLWEIRWDDSSGASLGRRTQRGHHAQLGLESSLGDLELLQLGLVLIRSRPLLLQLRLHGQHLVGLGGGGGGGGGRAYLPRPMHTYLISRYSSVPYRDPSRPSPDSFMPPKGATSLEMMPSLTPTMPYSSASAARKARPTSRVNM
mmetsp:Transcript_4794/g.14875  ORF Transcript_4794/g.14875 Transcript_4794/m.14875 type:complete len:230 (+) Transcript_4794:186-875(+)